MGASCNHVLVYGFGSLLGLRLILHMQKPVKRFSRCLNAVFPEKSEPDGFVAVPSSHSGEKCRLSCLEDGRKQFFLWLVFI